MFQRYFFVLLQSKTRKMLRFLSFGSGSSGNCYYLYTENFGLLIDIGISMRRLKKYFTDYGLHMSDVKAVIVTHDHADHVKSVGQFSALHDVPVYATALVHEGIATNYCVRKKIPQQQVKTFVKGDSFDLGPFQISTFDVPHDSKENVGFQITFGGKVFCLMTDIGHFTEEMQRYVGGAEYLVVEANHDEDMLRRGPYPPHLKERVAGDRGHLSNSRCAEVLVHCASPALKHVWLCHLSEENNHPELARKTIELALNKHNGIVIDVLKRCSPSGDCILCP